MCFAGAPPPPLETGKVGTACSTAPKELRWNMEMRSHVSPAQGRSSGFAPRPQAPAQLHKALLPPRGI